MRDRSLESRPAVGHVVGGVASSTPALVLATISFTLSFALNAGLLKYLGRMERARRLGE
jgi:hypothetical protein